MRSKIASVLALAALAISALAAHAATLTVPVDQSRRLPIGGAAANIVVGNTAIADVRAIDTRTLMVVGKRQGVTNVVVLDLAGRTLFDGEIVVSAASSASITVYRGAQATDYACAPYCSAGPASAAPPAMAPAEPRVVEPAAPAPAAAQ